MFASHSFFFNDTATTEIYTDSHTRPLHDALPIYPYTTDGKKSPPVSWDAACLEEVCGSCSMNINGTPRQACSALVDRSEEHTSELQSLMRISYAVFCLQKKKTT